MTDAEVSDNELVSRIKAGDYDAFETLVRRYHEKVHRLVFGMLQNESETEEVVQEAFLNIFRNITKFEGKSAPGTWIYRIAANASLMRLRSRRRKPLLALEDFPNAETPGSIWPTGAWADQPDDKLLNAELQERIQDAIAHLPEKYRMVILLRDVEGLSNNEIADTLGLSLPTVKARIHRARIFVRETLAKYFVGK